MTFSRPDEEWQAIEDAQRQRNFVAVPRRLQQRLERSFLLQVGRCRISFGIYSDFMDIYSDLWVIYGWFHGGNLEYFHGVLITPLISTKLKGAFWSKYWLFYIR